MENVDEIILHQLRSIDIHLEDNVEAIRDLSIDDVYHAISSCLRIIHPEKSSEFPRNLPPNMSARYTVCGKAAENIIAIGYRGEIGYQTILYGSEVDIRNVLVFLIDKLPKEHHEGPGAVELSRFEMVLKSVKSELSVQQNQTWIPSQYRDLASDVDHNELRTDTVPENKFGLATLVEKTRGMPHVLSASIIDALAMAKFSESSPNFCKMEIDHYESEVKAALQAVALLSKVAKKSGRPIVSRPIAKSGEVEEHKNQISSPEEEEKRKVDQAQELQGHLTTAKEKLGTLLSEISTLNRQKGDIENETQTLAREIEESEGIIAERDFIAKLLPNSEENIENLKAAIAHRREKVKQLRRQWLELKASLETKLDTLAGRQDADERLCLEKRQAEAERDREEVFSQNALKEEAIKNLEHELEQMSGKDPSRSVYTKRIVDMIKNTKKQKTEIQKIAADTRGLQKELNSLNDKVDRAFAIADEMVYRDSKRNETARKIYRLLAGMHTDFGLTVSAVEDAESTQRKLDDTETQVEAEGRKGWPERAAKVAQDLAAIRNEKHSS